VADTRTCEHCGSVFAPRREHARFCSARCRVAWNREQARDRAAEETALDWSFIAMRDATGRLQRARDVDYRRALAAISEAVWWVTIVDGTLVRYHPGTYDGVLATQSDAERRLTEGTLAGLRFARNRMGHHLDPADFISQPAGPTRPASRISAWTWTSLPEPELGSTLDGRAKAWELSRYQAYEAQLAGHTVGEIFTRAATFLTLTVAQASCDQDAGTSDLVHLRQHGV
jgi:predicted nucleic acid-binding Zn ribbon protein